MTEESVSKQDYLSAGIHIGMKSRTRSMNKFIYKVREDGLAVLNLKVLDDRIGIAGKMLSRSKNILVVGRRANASEPIRKFAEVVGCDYVIGRFMPGTLTNPNYEEFKEPDVVLLTDPSSDRQALKEASLSRIPIIAMCDTSNETKGVDLIIPCNNKGKKSLAFLYWLLAKKIFENKKKKKFKWKVEEFGSE